MNRQPQIDDRIEVTKPSPYSDYARGDTGTITYISWAEEYFIQWDSDNEDKSNVLKRHEFKVLP